MLLLISPLNFFYFLLFVALTALSTSIVRIINATWVTMK